MRTKIIIAAVILAAAAILAAFLISMSVKKKQNSTITTFIKTEKLQRATIVSSIAATGTVEPEELVNVSAQVNGKIMSFGTDADGKTVDFGSKVKQGMLLALIDDVPYKAELQQAKAQKQQAEAQIQTAKANILAAEANFTLAEQNWKRAQRLYQQKSVTESDYDSCKAAYNSADAERAKAKASLASANAQLASASASLVKAERNTEYCSIISPVDGIVIDRRVSLGQTVVSNQTASSIFLVAKDFKKMQVWVSVNEADIGEIKVGMKVLFSCDAFPGTEFEGTVKRIRLNATLSSNVVTYIVEVNADNSSGKLLPYLTANVKFIRRERKDVLALTASALRFRPPEEFVAEGVKIPKLEKRREAIIWLKNSEQKLYPVKIKTGLSNGQMTEIISSVKEGTEIAAGIEYRAPDSAAQAGNAKNPFMPNMPKFKQRGSAGQRERAQERQKESSK